MLSWNVRGMNNGARQEELRQMVPSYKPDLICLQETKLDNIFAATVSNSLGSRFEDNFVFKLAEGTGGGGGSLLPED
jgi:exonuclease III